MHSQDYFSQLESELIARLPKNHTLRIVGELTDHLEDSSGLSQIDVSQQLGDASFMAKKFIDEYRGRTIVGRHPWLSMVAIPVLGTFLMAIASLLVCLLCLLIVFPACGIEVISGEAPSQLGFMFAVSCVNTFGLLVFVAATCLTGYAWNWTGRGFPWMLGATIFQVIAASLMISRLDLSPESISATVGCGTELDAEGRQVLAQMLIPLLVAVPIFRRRLCSAEIAGP